MPKSAIKSYEDWTPPKFLQGEDDDIDLERVRLEFYTRESENAQYRHQNRALKSQVSDLRSQIDGEDDGDDSGDDFDEAPRPTSKGKNKSEGEGQGPSLTEIRLKIALEKGLTYNQAMRLHGDTEEALQADAEAYMEEHGITSSDSKNEEGEGSEPESSPEPPRRQPRRGDVKSGTEREGDSEPTHYDPAKFLDQV